MPKVNMIEKSETLGSRYVKFNPAKYTKLGFLGDSKTEEKIAEYERKGHSFFQVGEGLKSIVYVSDAVDGLCRDIAAEVETNGWNKNIQLNNYETNDAIWASDVDLWFQYAMQDELFKANINTMSADALNTPPTPDYKTKVMDAPFNLANEVEKCKNYLQLLPITKKGGTGKRPAVIHLFVLNWIKKYIDRYMFRNNTEYRQRKLGLNRKKKW